MIMDRKNRNIMAECYVDTAVINVLLGYDGRTSGIMHGKGCNNVCKFLKEKDGFAIGIIDMDKRQPVFSQEFTEEISFGSVRVKKHPQRPQYLIFIYPAMDKFLLDLSKESNVSPKDFQLPEELEEFKTVTKTEDASTNENLRRFIKSLRHSETLTKLSTVIKYILNNPFNADLKHQFSN